MTFLIRHSFDGTKVTEILFFRGFVSGVRLVTVNIVVGRAVHRTAKVTLPFLTDQSLKFCYMTDNFMFR